MTPMTKQDFIDLGAPDLVYVRRMTARELVAGHVVKTIQGVELDPDQELYAVHSAAGERLAVLADREAAFAAAVAHELAPVSVH